MTRDEIIKLARETLVLGPYESATGFNAENTIKFAKLLAQHEREACAKMVEDSWMAFSRAPNSRLDITPFPELEYVAKVIRARGQA